MKKIIYLVIILAVVFGGVYLWQKEIQTPEVADISVVMDGWQTYKNDQYGFEIKYPPNVGLSPQEFFYQMNGADIDVGIRLDSDYFTYPQVVSGAGSTFQGPKYSIIIKVEPFATRQYGSKSVSPAINYSTCKFVDGTDAVFLNSLDTSKVNISSMPYCRIEDNFDNFLNNIKTGLAKYKGGYAFMYSGGGVTYVNNPTTNQPPINASLVNYDFDYRLSSILFKGGNVNDELSKIKQDSQSREKLLAEILSTFKFTK